MKLAANPDKPFVIPDGIINPEQFFKEKIKLLLICKEPNGKNHADNPGSFIDIWGNGEPNYQFAHRVAELAYGVLNNFPPYDDIHNNASLRLQTLKRIAFVNVKKTPGTATSNNTKLLLHVKQNKAKILEQIEEIKPSHILLGVSDLRISKALFDDVSFTRTGFGAYYGKWNNVHIYHFFHPSAQVGNAALYSFLKVNFEVITANGSNN